MRLLFLTKRYPQQRDLIERPYGRFYHLPIELAALCHEVRVQLVSHRRLDSVTTEQSSVHWSSHDLLSLGLSRTWQMLLSETMSFRPDWVIGCSDTWFGWLAHRLARRADTRLAVDAYDNYESYMPWNLPLHRAWRRAVRAADLVTAAGPQLAAYLQQHRQGHRDVELLPMAADPAFVPIDREMSRRSLALPDAVPLIGYSGSWSRNRGTRILMDSFERVRSARPDANLVLTGRPPAKICSIDGVISLGYLDDEQLPALLNALDVACVITTNTSFGRYSHPVKLCEAMACGVPVVATGTEPVRWMLNDNLRFIAAVGDADAVAARILANLDVGCVDYGQLPSWQRNGKHLEEVLRTIN